MSHKQNKERNTDNSLCISRFENIPRISFVKSTYGMFNKISENECFLYFFRNVNEAETLIDESIMGCMKLNNFHLLMTFIFQLLELWHSCVTLSKNEYLGRWWTVIK